MFDDWLVFHRFAVSPELFLGLNYGLDLVHFRDCFGGLRQVFLRKVLVAAPHD